MKRKKKEDMYLLAFPSGAYIEAAPQALGNGPREAEKKGSRRI